jgi:hypothetical protein
LTLSPTTLAASRTRDVARPAVWRRRLEQVLGLLWLLDGALQFQPSMFRPAFLANLFGMATMGMPGPLSSVLFRATEVVTAHPVVWNAVFATVQVALGLGLLYRPAARFARPASIVWALSVWVAGEGVGGLFMPGMSALNGAPGAAVLYVFAALMLWPRRRPDAGAERGTHTEGTQAPGTACAGTVPARPVSASTASTSTVFAGTVFAGTGAGETAVARDRGEPPPRKAAADDGLLGGALARWCWAALWVELALLELGSANHARGVPAAEISDIGNGEPAWLAWLNHHAGQLLAGHGAAFAAAAGLAAVLIGLGILHPRTRWAALAAGIVLALAYGLLGQDFGGLLTGDATDPGTAPLLVLIAVALWPRRRRTPAGQDIPSGRQAA